MTFAFTDGVVVWEVGLRNHDDDDDVVCVSPKEEDNADEDETDRPLPMTDRRGSFVLAMDG